jgi:hypothetical protein
MGSSTQHPSVVAVASGMLVVGSAGLVELHNETGIRPETKNTNLMVSSHYNIMIMIPKKSSLFFIR